jgi:hypothetical protein
LIALLADDTFAKMPIWRRSAGASAGLTAALACSACGPIEYLSAVTFDAARVLAEAKVARAAELAPYEYTAAAEYLHKARELGGHARFQEAVGFGKKAKDLGLDARRIARARTFQPPSARDE